VEKLECILARALVRRSVTIMKANGAKEVCAIGYPLWFTTMISGQVVLETEFDNAVALAFYASMGFMREKRLFRFYMNGKDAFRYVDPFGDLASFSLDCEV